MFNLPDHPDIAAALRNGYPGGYEPMEYRCPECGEVLEALDTVYMLDGEAVACRYCFVKGEFDPDEIEELDAEDAFY